MRTTPEHIFLEDDGAIMLRKGRGDKFECFVVEEKDVDLAIAEMQKRRDEWQRQKEFCESRRGNIPSVKSMASS